MLDFNKFKQKARVNDGHFIDESKLFRIGKYKGISVEDVCDSDPNYVEWVYDTTIDKYDLEVLESILF